MKSSVFMYWIIQQTNFAMFQCLWQWFCRSINSPHPIFHLLSKYM